MTTTAKDNQLTMLDQAAGHIIEPSKPTQRESTTSSAPELSATSLWKTREWLDQQIFDHKAALHAEKIDKGSITNDVDKLESRAVELQNELLESHTDASLRTFVLQRLQLGNTLMKSIYPEEPQTAGNTLIKRKVESLLEMQSEMGSTILRIHEEINQLNPVLEEKRTKNLELLKSNRELMWNLEQSKERMKEQQKGKTSQGVKSAMQNYDRNVAKVELIRHSLQGLILASGVNWAQTDELRELMLELGTPVEHLLNSKK